ncbi:MAG: tRNA pseudouridine(55) synthase TruB, partial [Acidimicrobiia bacterium]
MNGFLLVDKPSAWTSHDVVAKVRGLARLKKVGHAGTLDPMATGLLVLGLGNATRLLRFVQSLPKEYHATALMGVATDSLDADGAVLEREPMPVSAADVTAVLDRFRGAIMQTPPMVSARKVGGKRLYDLARQGETVEREARPVTIHELELTDFAPSDYPEVSLRVVCSTGTYIRTLADDIAAALGGRAHLVALRRVRNGSLAVSAASTIEELEEAAATDALEGHVISSA